MGNTGLSLPIAKITVGIPTYARGTKILHTLKAIYECDPVPAEVIVHVDATDGKLEESIAKAFPSVRILSSRVRVGPGGGRHRCINSATQPYFVSFDDDSWPIDRNFFAELEIVFVNNTRIAVIGASIYDRSQIQQPRTSDLKRVYTYTGCGYGLRVSAYSQTTGHLDRYCPYGFEELDIALQLHSRNWELADYGALRVFHDTNLSHHPRAEITAGTIENAALITYLRYPVSLWYYGLLQYFSVIIFMVRYRRFKGLLTGFIRTPFTLWNYRRSRFALPSVSVRSYLSLRRNQFSHSSHAT